MGVYIQDSFAQVIEKVRNGKCSFLEAEEEILGSTMPTWEGAWQPTGTFPRTSAMPSPITTVRFVAEQASSTAWLVYLSDQACLMMGIDGGVDALAYKGLEDVMDYFHIKTVDLEKCFITLVDELESART
jgi:hypothetical protein